MSWLARSIANSLRLDDDGDAAAVEEEEEERTPDDVVPRPTANDAASPEDLPRDTLSAEDRRSSSEDSDGDLGYNRGGDDGDLDGDDNQGRGVKEDLSEFRDSLTRQLWGVASFLAPPPPPPPPPPLPFSQKSASLPSEKLSGGAGSPNDDEEKNEELVEYEEGESGQFEEPAYEDYYTNLIEGAIGITEEVLAFARNIAHHPETWLDFPLSEEEEFDDFDISDSQYKHAVAVEHLAPRLAALRIELCPVHMSECYFWMVYFVLLHSRLNKHDADLLSSPQIVEARAMWMHELQKQNKESSYWLGMNTFYSKESAYSPRENTHSHEDSRFGSASHQTAAVYEIDKHSCNEVEFVDKSVIKEDPSPNFHEKEIIVVSSSSSSSSSSIETPMQENNNDIEDDDDDEDDWLKEDSDLVGYCSTTIIENEEDISFSDLEDDSDCTVPIKYKLASTEGNTTAKISS
ncbi:hypothetical protein ABFS83_03G038400 [Erythranthe nasuta]